MNSKIKSVMMKELKRFFSDRRVVFTTIIMPGLMIYLMYSLMGQALEKEFQGDTSYVSQVYIQNMPNVFDALKEDLTMKILESKDLEEMKSEVQEKKADLLVIFPEGFEEKVESYDSRTASDEAPNVEVYYNSTSSGSYNTYEKFNTILNNYEAMLANKFDVNRGDTSYDMMTQEDATGKTFSKLLPMLMMIFLFSGCLAVAPESIAGEKERGTMATLLVTPTKRSDIAIGKILSLSIIALLSGFSSFLGTMLSVPKLMAMESGEVSAAAYKVGDYIMLFLVIISTVLVLISLISVISAFAKSVKEASTYVAPLMLIVGLLGISSMITDGSVENILLYVIPCFNSAQCMAGIFGFSYSTVSVVITVVSNLVVASLFVFVLDKMFNSEKMMY